MGSVSPFFSRPMQRNKKICLGASFAGCTLVIVCLIIALSTPWYSEVTEVDGKIQTMVLEVSTHAFYWSFYCEGNSCNTFTIQGKPTNGVYSWYDICQDCDSQLTLYVVTWVLTFIATILLSILWLIHVVIIAALSKGYPSKGVSLLLPTFWTLSTIVILVTVIVFASTLPGSKSDDNSQCRRFLDAFIDTTETTSPCESFIGEMEWNRPSTSGFVMWGPGAGFIFLIIALVSSPFGTILAAIISSMIRRTNTEELDYGMIPMDDAMGLQMDNSYSSGFVTPGL